jgi:hypothetical protein
MMTSLVHGFYSLIVAFALFLANSGLTQDALAAKFSNQFTEFELPPQWQCHLEGAEWVCQSEDATKTRDAIVVLAAKLKGDKDSLDQYQSYLDKEKEFLAPNGKKVKSSPRYAKSIEINQHPWVDSLHLESEVPGFYTRYLATVKQDIAVLITYSINKAKYQDYLPQFDAMVKSIKVFRKASGGINQVAGGSLFNSNSAAISNSGLFSANQLPTTDGSAGEKKKPAAAGGNGDMLLYGLLLAGGVGFIIWKKKRGQG